jgi:catechol 2,3-dioxygenase-like lactoylglutathione lyase family enzyme
MQFGRVIPQLRMFNEEKTRAFYLHFLGCKVDWEHRFSPEAPLYMQVSRDGMIVQLSDHHGDGSPGCRLSIEMEGIDAFHAEIAAKPYNYYNPAVEEAFWGNDKVMTVIDPAGNHIQFIERKTPA